MEQIQGGPMSGNSVLVTGARSGIGKATALDLARTNAHLAITGRDRARIEFAAAEIRTCGGGKVEVFIADVSAGHASTAAGRLAINRPDRASSAALSAASPMWLPAIGF